MVSSYNVAGVTRGIRSEDWQIISRSDVDKGVHRIKDKAMWRYQTHSRRGLRRVGRRSFHVLSASKHRTALFWDTTYLISLRHTVERLRYRTPISRKSVYHHVVCACRGSPWYVSINWNDERSKARHNCSAASKTFASIASVVQ